MKNNPNIELPPNQTVTILNRLLLMIIIGNLIYVFISLPGLPDEVPIHFNLIGEADGWGNKAILLMLPLMFKVVFILLYVFSKDPSMWNFPVKVTEENAIALYQLGRMMLTVMNFQIGLLLVAITFHSIQIAKGASFPGILMSILLVVIVITGTYFIVRMRKLK